MDLTEKLISLVQENPCLYDCRIKNYKNIAKKDMVWEQIANELEQNTETIKNKWKNLKDGYAKYKKSFTGHCSVKVSKYGNWVWGPYLSFLDGAAMMRPMKLDGTSECTNTTEANTDLLSTYKSEDNSGDASNVANDSSIQEFLQLSTSRLSRKRRGSNHDDDYQIEERYSNVHKDSIDLLFESYAKSLKQMKRKTQAAIKIKLAQIFADAELEDLQPDNQNAAAEQCNQSAVYSVLSTINDTETYPADSVYGEEVKKE